MNSKEGPKKHHSEILRIKQLNNLTLKIMRKSNKCKMVFKTSYLVLYFDRRLIEIPRKAKRLE